MADGDFPPVALPAGLPTGQPWLRDVRCVQFVSKISSRSAKNDRIVMVIPPFLMQTRLDGSLTRILGLDSIGNVQYDRKGNKVLLISRPDAHGRKTDRDWSFEWRTSEPRNTFTPDQALDCINHFRQPLIGPNEPPLAFEPYDFNYVPVLKLQDGMKTPKTQLGELTQDRGKIPRPVAPAGGGGAGVAAPPPPGAAPPHAQPAASAFPAAAGQIPQAGGGGVSHGGVLNTCTVNLDYAGEPLRMEYEARPSANPAEQAVIVIGLHRGGAAERARVPRGGRVHSIDGQTVLSVEDMLRALGGVRDAGRTQYNMVIEGPVQRRLEIQLDSTDEALGIDWAATDDNGLRLVHVSNVHSGGPFERAGGQPCRLVSIDGEQIHRTRRMRQLMLELQDEGRTSYPIVIQYPDDLAMDPMGQDEGSYGDEEMEEGPEMTDMVPSAYTVEPEQVPGATKAVVIGVTYQTAHSDVRLPGSAGHARALMDSLLRRGFGQQRLLLDDGSVRSPPTRAHVVSALQWLLAGAQPGHSLFLGVVAHGVNIPGGKGKAKGVVAGFAPTDYREKGLLTEKDLWPLLVDALPSGARLFVVADLAYCGSALPLPFRLMSTSDNRYDMKETTDPNMSQQVLQLSMQPDPYTSRRVSGSGALARAFLEVLRRRADPTWQQLIDESRDVLVAHVGDGTPCPELGSTRRYDPAADRFGDAPPMQRRISFAGEAQEEDAEEEQPEEDQPPLARRGSGSPTPVWLLGGRWARREGQRDLLHMPLPVRPRLPGGGRWAPPGPPTVDPQHRRRLIEFYRYYNPDRLPYVTCMLIRYKGSEATLFNQLCTRYGPEPRDLIDDQLPDGWQQVQSPRGDVFYRHADGRRQWDRPARRRRPVGGPPVDDDGAPRRGALRREQSTQSDSATRPTSYSYTSGAGR